MSKLSFLSTTNHSLCSNKILFPLTVPRKIFFPKPKWTRNVVTDSVLSPKKIVVIMGATGSGKSKLSIDLATRFFPSEVINSDKIQVYNGLEITTNKISMPERKGVPHHLLGEFNASESHPEFSPSDFRSAASCRINEIINRGKIPLIVGGSNSFIYALLAKRFNPKIDFLGPSNPVQWVSNELRYECCFIWVDVLGTVLNQYLDKRVDEMLSSGMVEELEEYFKKEGFSDSKSGSRNSGIRKAIGVPEFERYFKGEGLYEEAAKEIKENTRVLAERQVGKIVRLREAGWNLQRVDATAAFTAVMTSESGKSAAKEIWEEQVLEPSAKIVKQFLLEQQ
ncbi:adenylate isopentenyltransferase isoform X1 [Nicotiana tabacum]|uniref:Adenylate isopentenyltransferase isoform X1 n=4 Tax=Nicotiana TaxID=4085 RepID=A0A1S3X0V3_TOBAC|nr:PREDICTED: adenylate isopentenyltransferase isoform X1 [Nicotiana sylvestris]XP_016433547.1 PREDICTED: adenylate isopentenyltransferase isoform X1 [Nicotiana tabacum]